MKIVTIGFIDDNRDDLVGLEKSIIDKKDCQAYISENPEEAYVWANQNKIDVLASDFNLERKDMDGLDLLKEIRLKNPTMPLMLYTGGAITKKEIEILEEYDIDYSHKEADFKLLTEKTYRKGLSYSKRLGLTSDVKNRIYEDLKNELISELKNQKITKTTLIAFHDGQLNSQELIEEIKKESELGNDFVQYFNNVKLRHNKVKEMSKFDLISRKLKAIFK